MLRPDPMARRLDSELRTLHAEDDACDGVIRDLRHDVRALQQTVATLAQLLYERGAFGDTTPEALREALALESETPEGTTRAARKT